MRTVAAPMPREPPVIKATLPERERGIGMETSFQLMGSLLQVGQVGKNRDRNTSKCEPLWGRVTCEIGIYLQPPQSFRVADHPLQPSLSLPGSRYLPNTT